MRTQRCGNGHAGVAALDSNTIRYTGTMQNEPTTRLTWTAAALTHVGRRRSQNEDAFAALADVGLFVVADGMGGHAAGEVASALAVDTIINRLATSPSPDLLPGTLQEANTAIRDRAAADPAETGMGTTATALLLETSGTATIAHVGDSRAYFLRDDLLQQLTRDHTWVQQQVDAGLLPPLQARYHPFASILTRALGTDPVVDVDVISFDVQPGDRLLLCSDGLTGMIEDSLIAQILSDSRPLDRIAKRLVHAANRAGGLDNITALVIRVEQHRDPDAPAPRPRRRKRVVSGDESPPDDAPAA